MDLPVIAHVQSFRNSFKKKQTKVWNTPATFARMLDTQNVGVSLHCWNNLMTSTCSLAHTRVCVCMYVCMCVCLTAVSSLAQTLFIAALQNHTSLQINPASALTAIRRSACAGESLRDARARSARLTFTVYTCIQFLCWVLWDSLLVISTFTTKLEFFSGPNIFRFCSQLAWSQSGATITGWRNVKLNELYTVFFLPCPSSA